MTLEPEELARRHAPVQVQTAGGAIGYRRAGAGAPLVLLHGIGSGSGSWVRQLESLSSSFDVMAWDAPGYGASAPVPAPRPSAQDYGRRVWQWLDALGVQGPVTLVGHSLGAIMAAAATGLSPARVARLVLLSPAQGYGAADEALRESKRNDRLNNLNTLGPQGMAQRRGAAMLSPAAPASLVAYVQSIMAQVIPAGYTQATHLLADADLAALLREVRCPAVVGCGDADAVTPPQGCQALAQVANLPYVSLGAAGHACALEAPQAVNALLYPPK